MTERAQRPAARTPALPAGSFLPELCQPGTILALVLAAALVAFVLALARSDELATVGFWVAFAASAWLLLWITLGSAALLCVLRRSRLAQRGVAMESVAALVILGAVTAAASAAAVALGWRSGPFAGLMTLDLPVAPLPVDPEGQAFVLRNVLLAWLLGGLALRYAYITHRWRGQVEAESRARVAALQARIQPHFLFNSLNTLAALAPVDGARTAAAVEDLADLFRASLSATAAGSDVRREVAVGQAYLRLEQARLGDRLMVIWDLEALPEETAMPALMLQPLLENAVFHGVEPLVAGGCVRIRGGIENGSAWLTIENPVPLTGHSPAAAARGHQEALANIRERLRLLFGEGGSLATTGDSGHFVARLRWPLQAGTP